MLCFFPTCDNVYVWHILRAQIHGLRIGLEGLSEHLLLGLTSTEPIEADDVEASFLDLLGAPFN